MPYRYLDDVAIADLAFEATGPTLESAFSAAADAMLGGMVEDPATVAPRESRPIRVEADAADRLLFRFLQELVFLKDTERLLLRVPEVRIHHDPVPGPVPAPAPGPAVGNGIGIGHGAWRLEATAKGEPIDSSRHELTADVKAVTLHMLNVENVEERWRVTAVVDV